MAGDKKKSSELGSLDPQAQRGGLGFSSKGLSLAEQAHQAIRLAIRQRRFRSGDRLIENELADMLGLSRTPIREALSRLQAEGLAEQHPHRGFTVVEFDHAMVAELYQMREALEGTAARLAAKTADEAELSLLESLHLDYVQLVQAEDSGEIAMKNRQFHEALILCAHNRFLLRTMEPLHDALGLLGESNMLDLNRAKENINDHANILSALMSKDAQAAELAAREHIKKAYSARVKRMFTKG
jgi:DNA-binding GntR family transcriptional regulator